MLEPFERFLNTPTLMVKLAKNGCRELVHWQIGRHHPNEPIGRHTLDQPDLRRSTRAAIVRAVQLVGLIERDGGIDLITALKRAHRCPATTGLLAAHAKADIVLSQIRHQPSRRIAAIKNQHIILPQAR
jgi:hypothetical protein